MVYAVVFELIFFGTLPSALSTIGALIIITAALYVAVRFLFSHRHRLSLTIL